MMVDFPNRNLKQTALYWGTPVPDGWGGSTWDDPVEISCRWEQKQELFIDATGEEVRSQAVVFISQDLDIGGYLMLGDLDNISSATQAPDDVDAAFEIRAFAKIPNIKATKFLRKAWL